jgi:hypothetical protein
MLEGKESESNMSMCGKIKHVLKERGSELPNQKSSRPTCFFCHPQMVPAEVSQDNTKEKKIGIKQLWFLDYKAKKHVREKPMQCNQTSRIRNQILGMCILTI